MEPAFGAPPVDPDTDLTFLGLDTRTPYLAEYGGADGGKPAHSIGDCRLRIVD